MTLSQTSRWRTLSACCSLGWPLPVVRPSYATLFKVLRSRPPAFVIAVVGRRLRPASVGELTETSGLSQITVSHHLKRLIEAGLLNKVRVGRRRLIRCARAVRGAAPCCRWTNHHRRAGDDHTRDQQTLRGDSLAVARRPATAYYLLRAGVDTRPRRSEGAGGRGGRCGHQ